MDTIRDLVSYQLQKATYYATRPAYQAYGAKFGVTGVEWRLLGNLFADGPMSVRRLSVETDIQISQASRTVASLVERGLVQSASDRADGRSVQLSLTAEGRALYRKLFAEARRWNEALLAALTPEEAQVLLGALDKIAQRGRHELLGSPETES